MVFIENVAGNIVGNWAYYKLRKWRLKAKQINFLRQLNKGVKTERKEHGFNWKISRKIALDHLKENKNYYKWYQDYIIYINNLKMKVK